MKQNSLNNIVQKYFRISFCVLAGLGIVLIIFVIAFVFGDNKTSVVDDVDFSINIVDVGQGDAVLIVLPTNEIALIDAGSVSNENKLLQYLDTTVLKDPNKMIDYAILTHPDDDHYGGLSAVLQKYGVRKFYRPNVVAYNPLDSSFVDLGFVDSDKDSVYGIESYSYSNAVDSIYKYSEQVSINTDMPQIIKGHTSNLNNNWTISIYPFGTKQIAGNVDNNYSPVIIVECRQNKFVFSGDSDGKILSAFVGQQQEHGILGLGADFVLLGHHGSNSNGTNSKEFLEYVFANDRAQDVNMTSKIVAISVGKNNYGHPSTEVLARLQQMGVDSDNIYRTDYDGNIVVSVDKNEHSIVSTIVLQTYDNIIASIAQVSLILFVVIFALLCILITVQLILQKR